MSKRSIPRRTASRLLLVAAAIALGGCSLFTSDAHRVGFYLINRTPDPIDVTFVRMGQRTTVADDLTPDGDLMVNRFVSGDECADASLVATDQAGAIVATFPGPVCDQTEWEILASQPTP